MTAADSASTVSRLDALLGVTRLVRAGVPRGELLEGVAAAIAHGVGFGTVVVNLRTPGGYEAVEVHGGPAVRAALLGTRSTESDWAPLLDPRFRTAGAYLVPAGAVDWEAGPAASFLPEIAASADPGAWQAEDALLVPLAGATGEPVGIVSVDEPVTGRRPGPDELALLVAMASHLGAAVELADLGELRARRESEARKAAMLEASLDAILTMDGEGTLLEFSPAAERIFGHRREDVLGRDLAELVIPPDLRDAHRAGLRRYAAGARGGAVVGNRIEVRAMRADGSQFPCEIAVVPIEGDGPPVLTAYLRDISDRVADRRALERERDLARHRALHDPVTNLPNRAAVCERLQARLPEVAGAGGALVAIGLGLTDFDLITESLGHEPGADLLRAVAARLERHRDGPGTLVAHLGSGEFLVLGETGSPCGEDARATAAAVARCFEEPYPVGGLELRPEVAIGFAVLEEAGPPDELLRRVAVARRRAGAGGLEAYAPARDTARARLSTLSALHGAPERGELELHYQPLVGAESGRLVGLEALLRWRRDGALVPPLEFIGLAETSGLIVPIGEWVIGEACRQIGAWADAGLEVPVVGINVSPRQIPGTDLAAVVHAALERHGVAPDRLCVEVTETAAAAGDGPVVATLRELHALGVRTALDDFGADRSSLARVASLPVRMIKLDRGFVRGVPEDPRACALLRGVLGVAAAMQVMTVVEGVETESQLEAVRELGADIVQGFVFARPEPAGAVARRLAPRAAAVA